jgi:hypothetical protein
LKERGKEGRKERRKNGKKERRKEINCICKYFLSTYYGPGIFVGSCDTSMKYITVRFKICSL